MAAALSAVDVRGLRPAIAFFGARALELPKVGIIFPHSIVWSKRGVAVLNLWFSRTAAKPTHKKNSANGRSYLEEKTGTSSAVALLWPLELVDVLQTTTVTFLQLFESSQLSPICLGKLLKQQSEREVGLVLQLIQGSNLGPPHQECWSRSQYRSVLKAAFHRC